MNPVFAHCSLHPSQVFRPTFQDEEEDRGSHEDLHSISDSIDAKYANGVVHGFSEEPGSELIW